MMLCVSERDHVSVSSLLSYPFTLPVYSGALSSFLPRTAHFLLKFRIISQVSGFFQKRTALKNYLESTCVFIIDFSQSFIISYVDI